MNDPMQDLQEYLHMTEAQIIEQSKKSVEQKHREWNEKKDEADYYLSTNYFLYDLTQYQADPGRKQMRDRIKNFVKQLNAKICCDYGSGIGDDSLAMLEAGAEIVFMVDYMGETARYGLWRIWKHGMIGKIRFIGLNRQGMPNGTITEALGRRADLISSIATLEHCQDPSASLAWIHDNADHAILRPDPSHPEIHVGHHAEHFEYLMPLLNISKGQQAHGFEKIDQDNDPPLFKVIR